jgi:hypothetical protein
MSPTPIRNQMSHSSTACPPEAELIPLCER